MADQFIEHFSDCQFFSLSLHRHSNIWNTGDDLVGSGRNRSRIGVMRSTLFGRWAYAVGLNARAARVAGVPVERVILISYVISGFTAGLTSIFLTARLGSASASMGNDGVVLDIVSACVVGGVSIYGGAGRVTGAVFGAVLITVLSNAMNLIGVSYYLSLIIKGAVIIAFIAIEGRKENVNE